MTVKVCVCAQIHLEHFREKKKKSYCVKYEEIFYKSLENSYFNMQEYQTKPRQNPYDKLAKDLPQNKFTCSPFI